LDKLPIFLLPTYIAEIAVFGVEKYVDTIPSKQSPGLPDFLATTYQTGENIPYNQQIGQIAIKFTKWPKIYQMDINYTKWP
jgi:hypothetical protein